MLENTEAVLWISFVWEWIMNLWINNISPDISPMKIFITISR